MIIKANGVLHIVVSTLAVEWIEIVPGICDGPNHCVSTLAVEWIEIHSDLYCRHPVAVSTLAVEWIEIWQKRLKI